MSVWSNDVGTKISLVKAGWKYHPGDSAHWAENGFNDSLWASVSSTQETTNFPEVLREGIGWFRLRMVIDSTLAGQRVALKIGDVSGGQFYPLPMEVFLNNRCYVRQGVPAPSAFAEQVSVVGQGVEYIVLPEAGEYTLAVRASFHNVLQSAEKYHWLQEGNIKRYLGFSLAFVSEASGTKLRELYFTRTLQYLIAATIPCCIAFLHGLLFIFFRNDKSNLYLSLLALSSGSLAFVLMLARGVWVSSVENMIVCRWILNPLFSVLIGMFMLLAIFALKREQPHRVVYLAVVCAWFSAVAFVIVDGYGKWSQAVNASTVVASLMGSAIIIQIIIQMWKRQNSVWIIAVGISVNLVFTVISNLYSALGYSQPEILIIAFVWGFYVIPPLSMSIFVAYQTSVSNRLLARQRNELDAEVKERTQELSAANVEIKQQVDILNEQTVMIELNNAQLQEQLETLRRTQSQLAQAEKMASLGTLVAGVAHELNTPIGVAVTAASTLHSRTQDFAKRYTEGGMKKSELEAFVQTAQTGADLTLRNLERAANLIQSFKQVSVDQTYDNIRRFGVKQYLHEIITSLQPKWKTSGHRIEIECDETLEMETYAGAIAQIITNFVMNSLLHGFDGLTEEGVMRIEAEQEGNNVVIKYSDNGRGIPPEVLPRIFDPFFTTKQANGGTGLGMHIVYNLVTQKLGGTIQAESHFGSGVHFSIHIPNTIFSSK